MGKGRNDLHKRNLGNSCQLLWEIARLASANSWAAAVGVRFQTLADLSQTREDGELPTGSSLCGDASNDWRHDVDPILRLSNAQKVIEWC